MAKLVERSAGQGPLTTEVFSSRIGRIRSVSGFLSVIELLGRQDLDYEESSQNVPLLTELLEKGKELTEVTEIPFEPHDREERAILRAFGLILGYRSGQYGIGGVDLLKGEADARMLISIAERLEDHELYSLGVNYLGNSLLSQQRVEEAQHVFQLGVENERQKGRNETLARSLYNLARVSVGMGDFRTAAESVNEGLALYDVDPTLPPFGRAFFLNIRQDLYEHSQYDGHEIDDALECLRIMEEAGIEDRIIDAYFSLTRIHMKLDNISEAMDYVKKMEEISTTGNPAHACYRLTTLTGISLRIGDIDAAFNYGTEGLQIAEQGGFTVFVTRFLQYLADIARRRGDFAKAEELLLRNLEAEHHAVQRSLVYRTLTQVRLMQEDIEGARSFLNQGLDIARKTGRVHIINELEEIEGEILRKEEKYSDAAQLFQHLAQDADSPRRVRIDAYKALIDIYHETDQPAGELSALRKYHELVLEEERKIAQSRVIAVRAEAAAGTMGRRIRRLEEEKKELINKNEELALRLSQREEILNDLERGLRGELQGSEKGKGKSSKRLKDLWRLTRQDEAVDLDLHSYLRRVDREWVAALQKVYPDLTANQVRLCTLIRSGLTSSEIMRLLNITPDTLSTQRKRLRKRMNLDRGEKLERVLEEIGA